MKKMLTFFFLCLSLNLIGKEIENWSSPPDTISSPGMNSSDPHLGIDGNGNVIAIWLEEGTLVSRYKLLNQSWSHDTRMGENASCPQLVVDYGGNATAIWLENTVVKAAYKSYGSTWDNPIDLSGPYSSSPQLAVDDYGNVVAVWTTCTVVQSSTRLFGQTWDLPETLSNACSYAPQVAIGTNGGVIAVWHTLNTVTSKYNILSTTKVIDEEKWNNFVEVSDPTQDSVYPQIAMDYLGNSVIIWFNYDCKDGLYSNVFLCSSFRPPHGSWTDPVSVSSSGSVNPANLTAKVAYSSYGKALAIWTNSFDGSTYTISTSQTDDNQLWMTRHNIASGIYDYKVDVALNAIGDAFAVYMFHDIPSSSITIRTIESHVGGYAAGIWTTPTTLSVGNSNGYPVIDAVINGSECYAAAAWTTFNGVNELIQSRFGTGTAVYPPSDPIVTQSINNFGIFTEYYNTINWIASPSSDLLGYAIYRNGILIDFIDASLLQYIDHNRSPDEEVAYGISAVQISNDESAVISAWFIH